MPFRVPIVAVNGLSLAPAGISEDKSNKILSCSNLNENSVSVPSLINN